ARRFAERAPARANGDPGIIVHQNVFNGDDERVPALRALQPHRPAQGVGQGGRLVEARPPRGDGLVGLRPEVAGAGVIGLDLEARAGPDAEERLVFPVEGVLAGLVAENSLHGSLSRGWRWGVIPGIMLDPRRKGKGRTGFPSCQSAAPYDHPAESARL